jgi:hypothetical protein
MKIKTATGLGAHRGCQSSKIVLERSVSRRTPRRHIEATDIGSFSYSNICDENVVVHRGALLSEILLFRAGLVYHGGKKDVKGLIGH